MFEGNPPVPGCTHAPEGEPEQPKPLRPLSWGDLTTRLRASRELRASLRPREEGCEASFDAFSARRISAQANSKRIVNLDASGNRKPTGATVGVIEERHELEGWAPSRGNK
jgi:hypothetical protein